MSKDAGFKVVSHMMPDLPNVGWDRDIEQFIVSVCLYNKKVLSILDGLSFFKFRNQLNKLIFNCFSRVSSGEQLGFPS